MIQIVDAQSGTPLGTVTEEQLGFLKDQLEEEWKDDDDYYINRATLDLFAEAGADPGLLALLRGALGDREEMEIRWLEV
jgi:hypothetical protein